MLSLSSQNKSKKAIAAVEFLFAAPAFFILVFFVIEISLVWSDRHIMRLAAYRAAKAVVKTRAELDPNATGNLCWVTPTDGSSDEASEIVKLRARRAATKVMAMISPTLPQMLPAFGRSDGKEIEDGIMGAFSNGVRNVVNVAQDSTFLRAGMRMLRGLPSAWLLTSLNCKDAAYEGSQRAAVEITLTYQRSSKMPFVGKIMWLFSWLNSKTTGIPMPSISDAMPVDPLSYGIKLGRNTPQFTAYLNNKAAQAFDMISEKLQTATQNGLEELVANAPPNIIPPFFDTNTAISGVTEAIGDISTTFRPEVLNQVGSVINLAADQLGSFILALPDAIQFIPITVHVRLPNYNQAIVNQDSEWKAKTQFLGTLGDGSQNMGELSRVLGETVDAKTDGLQNAKE